MKKLLTFLIISISFATAWAYSDYTPADMPNVQVQNSARYVSDPAGLLSPEVTTKIDRQLAELRRSTSCEMVLAIPPSIGDAEPQQWCEQLFTDWGIGKSDRDNGVLLMLSPGSRAAFIMPGYGAEGVLTDIACANIYRNVIVPEMKAGNLDAAAEKSVDMICSALQDPAEAAELQSKQADNRSGNADPLDFQYFLNFIYIIITVLFITNLVVFIIDLRKSRQCPDNYSKARMWRSQLNTMWVLTFLTAGAGAIFLIITFILYRRWRTKKLICPNCNAKMHRLPEDKDNELLTDSQDFEEQLNTVDYDVWECPCCGTVERFAYKTDQSKYTKCDNCGTIAMMHVGDAVIRPATTRSEGEGEKIYECQYCHHRNKKRYKIPRKEDPAALAAGAALGAAALRGHRGGFGGGGFGGGFGGGSTGGGGFGGRF